MEKDDKKKGKKWLDKNVKRDIDVNRAIEGQVNKISRDISALHEEVIEDISKSYEKLTKKNLAALNNRVTRSTNRFYEKATELADNAFFLVVAREVDWNLKNIGELLGAQKYLNSEKIAQKALKKTFQGHTFQFWFKSLQATEPKKITAILSNGYVNGTALGELKREVQNVMGRASNDIKTLTRSYYHHAQAEARYDTLSEFDEAIEYYVWLSTLDHRTTPHICGVRDMMKFNKKYEPIGHSLQWEAGPGRIHFNCRSTWFAVFDGMEDIEESLTRPSFGSGEDYKRGDNITRNGKVRKPTRKNVENKIFKSEKVKGGTTYEDVLKKQNLDYITDVFKGDKDFAKQFKEGNKKLMDWVKQGTQDDINNI